MRRRSVLLGLAALPLAACAGARGKAVWAPDEEVARFRAPNAGPTSLALITVRNEWQGSGEHSALLIAASERVLYDPYGGWRDPQVPERNDVLYGMSDAALGRYLAYQARGGFFYQRQEVAVPPEVAEAAFERAKAQGPTGVAQCVNSIGTVLAGLPGFESLGRPWTPDALSRRFARLPGVVTTEVRGSEGAPGEASPQRA